MKKIIPAQNYITRRLVLGTAVICSYMILSVSANAQTSPRYTAPQDTVKTKRAANTPLTQYQTTKQAYKPDSRFVGAAVKAAEMLADTTKYDPKMGVSVEDLFSKEDLQYVVKQGVNGVAALFELVNQHLPKGENITFRADKESDITIGDNPLVLKNLRAMVSAKPGSISNNEPQWKENVYQAYMARDYGTKLNNTITITSATREIRETPELEIIDFDGRNITLGRILANKQAKINDKYEAEKEAVAEFREHTFPGNKISKENANENYRRALFQLMTLQEGDINRHPATKTFVDDLTNDLKKGKQSNVISALKSSSFFDTNVPGNMGPVLLTEDSVISADQVQSNARDKAMELTMLTALHYGERDAVKLFTKLIEGKGAVPAKQTDDFTPKRLSELTNHGTEKMKSLGYGADKVNNMTSSDLVLVAVAAPDVPVIVKPKSYLTLQQVGASIVKSYTVIETQETKNILMLNPRISLGSRHSEYRAAFDAVDYVPELLNGTSVNQKGSRVVQNGLELRVESDLYFSKPQKIIEKGVKPVIYPEFGVIAGAGTRKVGYDNSTTVGEFGAVPKFSNTYINWGGHAGINVGPVLIGMDATYLSSQTSDDPYKRFFDLSEGMTYYRYSLLAHVINFGLGNIAQGKGTHLTLDVEYAGETNNTGFKNRTITSGSGVQTGNAEWQRDYNRAHPNGTFNYEIANQMIINGDVKADYAASSYGAIHVGLQKSKFELAGTAGLYNLYTVPLNGKALVSSETIKNTFNGNLFGALTLTYHLGSGILSNKHKKTESYQSTNNVETPHQIDESSSEEKSDFVPRNHAIFTNGKSRLKPL